MINKKQPSVKYEKPKNVLKSLTKMDPEIFKYSNWSANWWNDMDLDYEQSCEDYWILRTIRDYGIGYCESVELQFRPMTDQFYAVMFEKDGYQFWCHIHKTTFESDPKDEERGA